MRCITIFNPSFYIHLTVEMWHRNDCTISPSLSLPFSLSLSVSQQQHRQWQQWQQTYSIQFIFAVFAFDMCMARSWFLLKKITIFFLPHAHRNRFCWVRCCAYCWHRSSNDSLRSYSFFFLFSFGSSFFHRKKCAKRFIIYFERRTNNFLMHLRTEYICAPLVHAAQSSSSSSQLMFDDQLKKKWTRKKGRMPKILRAKSGKS